MSLRLDIFHDQRQIGSVPLGNQHCLSIGRRDADIKVDSDTMSGRHFQLESAPQGWVCRDLESTNGTYVNGERISVVLLRSGDQIAAGGLSFVFSEVVDNSVRKTSRLSGLAFRKLVSRSGLTLCVGWSSQYELSQVLAVLAGDFDVIPVNQFGAPNAEEVSVILRKGQAEKAEFVDQLTDFLSKVLNLQSIDSALTPHLLESLANTEPELFGNLFEHIVGLYSGVFEASRWGLLTAESSLEQLEHYGLWSAPSEAAYRAAT